MRNKASDTKAKIVNRELAQVFTNGTIVDSAYLKTDEANYCVAIKVRDFSWSGFCLTTM